MRHTAWPDYCRKETLARRLDLSITVIDRYVQRGILPAPIRVGEAKLWRWSQVDQALSGAGPSEGTNVRDPYLMGIERA